MAIIKKIQSAPRVINNKGVTLVEVMVAIFVISVALISLLNVASVSVGILNNVRQSDRANLMVKEAQEAVRSFRNNTTWDTDGLGILSVGVNYYPELVTLNGSSDWNLNLGSELVGNFTRTIVIENVSRNSIFDDIDEVYVALNDDPETKKVIANVSWGNKEVELITYLTNWKQ